METIAVYYTALASTKLAVSLGFAIASHMAIVYTNKAGLSFGVSSGPSYHLMLQSGFQIIGPIGDMASNMPSGFGVLMSDPNNNHPFHVRQPEDYYTQDDEGTPYPSAVVATASDLSAQWRTIVATYTAVDGLHLTYSPISQNSNSMAGTALRAAGLPIPFSSATPFTPAVFTRLPISATLLGFWTVDAEPPIR